MSSPRRVTVIEPADIAREFELSLHNIFPDQDFFTFWTAFMPFSPLFLDAINKGTWPLVQTLIQLALQQNTITQDQYDAIKEAAENNGVPIEL